MILDVVPCLKALFWGVGGHGKSPCFFGCCVSAVVGPDCAVLKSLVVDGGFFLV